MPSQNRTEMDTADWGLFIVYIKINIPNISMNDTVDKICHGEISIMIVL